MPRGALAAPYAGCYHTFHACPYCRTEAVDNRWTIPNSDIIQSIRICLKIRKLAFFFLPGHRASRIIQNRDTTNLQCCHRAVFSRPLEPDTAKRKRYISKYGKINLK